MSQQFPPYHQSSDEGMQTSYPYSASQIPVYPPPQPAQAHKSFKSSWLWIVGLIVVFFMGFGVGKIGTDTISLAPTATRSASITPAATPSSLAPTNGQSSSNSDGATSSDHHKINETVSVDGIWQITVTKVYTSQGDEYTVPKQGDTFLQIDISMKNVSSIQRYAYESLFNLHDDSGQTYEMTFLGNAQPPDGQVSAGGPLKGTLTYEVPASTKSFVLSFSSTFESQLVNWDITA